MYNVTFDDKNEIYLTNKFIMRNEKLKKNVTICTDLLHIKYICKCMCVNIYNYKSYSVVKRRMHFLSEKCMCIN